MSFQPRPSRRTVLKTAAGAAAAPFIVSSSALGNAGQVAASERITLGFIGTGGRGTGILADIAAWPDVEILAISDVQKAKRDQALATLEAKRAEGKATGPRTCRTYRDFRELLARDDIDGVVIAACEHWRPMMCVMAAEAGKDVYTEKPFAISIKEAQAVAEAVRRHGRILQHGTQHRNHHRYRLSCEIARSGRIGRITHAETWAWGGPTQDAPDYSKILPLPDREEFDWEMWLGPAPWRPWPGQPIGWQGLRDFGLASIGNVNAHAFDMLQWTLGKEADSPVEILPGDADRQLTMRYADGVEIRFPKRDARDTGWARAAMSGNNGWSSLIHGTEGYKYIAAGSGPALQELIVRNALDEKYDATPLGPADVFMLPPHRRRLASDSASNVALWLEGIRTRTRTNCNEEVAYRNAVLCCLVDIMNRLQRPLTFDPVKAEFPGDAEANRLLDTPKRAPWRI